jgi:hypothetical protein
MIRAAALLFAAAVLAGCGGSGGGTTGATGPSGASGATGASGSGPPGPGAVRSTVATVLAPGDPHEVCTRLTTPAYVRAAYGDARGCFEAITAQPAAKVTVTAVKISGSRATAVAVPAGGPSKGEHIRVELVSERGTWRVDSASSNAPVGP